MSDKDKNFHKFLLQSSLFNGQSDLYFCFLKSEKIAHVLSVLAQHVREHDTDDFYALRDAAGALPAQIVFLASGSEDQRGVLADTLSLMTSVRLMRTRQILSAQTADILLDEYEKLAQRIDAGMRLSPFVTADDFSVPLLPESAEPTPLSAASPAMRSMLGRIKDTDKSHEANRALSAEHAERAEAILSFIRNSKGVSIKDIHSKAGPAVSACSEKTIQRELGELIRRGLIKKVGERRWSQYVPA